MRSLCPATTLSAIIVLALAGCSGEVEPGVTSGIDACRLCNMVIDRTKEACGYVGEGEFVPFDSPMCLLRDLDAKRQHGEPLPAAVFMADFRDGSFHPARRTSFLLTRHHRTVMDGGVLCFADRAAAEKMVGHEDEVVTDWNGFRTARGEPSRTFEVTVSADSMSPEVLVAQKGDLLLLKLRGLGLVEDLLVSVTGYPEMGTVTVPATGEQVGLRLLALRPGAGFPVVGVGSEKPLGMLKVAGAHTTDEEQE